VWYVNKNLSSKGRTEAKFWKTLLEHGEELVRIRKIRNPKHAVYIRWNNTLVRKPR
jgi:hypothetical protein